MSENEKETNLTRAVATMSREARMRKERRVLTMASCSHTVQALVACGSLVPPILGSSDLL